MSGRKAIYNHHGSWLTDIKATVNRTWKLNQYGSAEFKMAITDPKTTQVNLEYGNFIVCEHPKLPDWVGMLVGQVWDNGIITVQANQAEYIMETRITQRNQTIEGSPGIIFSTLITELWDAEDWNIVTPGTIFPDGEKLKREYHFDSLYSKIVELSKDSKCDWWLEPYIDNTGKLTFLANWSEKRGRPMTKILAEGKNIALGNNVLRVQGKIVNKLRMFGDGATWHEKPVASRNNKKSKDRFGPMFGAEYAPGVTKEELNALADTRIKETAYQRNTFSIIALDKRDTFNNLGMGNTGRLILKTYGFKELEDGIHQTRFGTDATVRILQMALDEGKSSVALVTDEETDVTTGDSE